jgi:hypothetical protein
MSTNRYHRLRSLKDSQKGVGALLFVLILMMLMTIMALTVFRTSVMEQKMTGNDIRAKEAQQAAEAGLEYGIAWAGKNVISWVGQSMICPGAAGCPVLAPISGSSSDEAYSISSLVYARSSADSDYIKVTSSSVASVETSISAMVSVYIKPGGLLTSQGAVPPPLVLDGCLTGTTGTPDIYPKWNDLNGNGIEDPGELEEAIITSQPDMVGGNVCLDNAGTGSNIHLNLHDGVLTNDVAFPDNDGDGNGTIWEYYFDVSPAQYQAAASTTLSSRGGAYYVTSEANWGGGTYGSAASPVIIVFENGCPKPTGGTTVYGIIFFKELNACVSDGMNGWGNINIYGSIGANGGVHKMNANLKIHGVGNGSALTSITEIPIDASKLPGTWTDF